MCDGPPCMNREIIAVACGGNWGGRGFKSWNFMSVGLAGGAPSSRSCCNIQDKAIPPMPKALRCRKSRRVAGSYAAQRRIWHSNNHSRKVFGVTWFSFNRSK